MDWNQYQDWVESKQRPEPDAERRLMINLLGLGGEAGEIMDRVKKVVAHRKPNNQAELLLEFGDALFYLAAAAKDCGFSLQEVVEANLNKLNARYPSGFEYARAHAAGEKPVEVTQVNWGTNVLRQVVGVNPVWTESNHDPKPAVEQVDMGQKVAGVKGPVWPDDYDAETVAMSGGTGQAAFDYMRRMREQAGMPARCEHGGCDMVAVARGVCGHALCRLHLADHNGEDGSLPCGTTQR